MKNFLKGAEKVLSKKPTDEDKLYSKSMPDLDFHWLEGTLIYEECPLELRLGFPLIGEHPCGSCVWLWWGWVFLGVKPSTQTCWCLDSWVSANYHTITLDHTITVGCHLQTPSSASIDQFLNSPIPILSSKLRLSLPLISWQLHIG